MVIVGQGSPPLPQLRSSLAEITRVPRGCAAVSVPDVAGDTVMVWPGSPETDTDQSTVPPDALRNSSAPRPPGTRKSEPPPGNTRSVPAGWLGDGLGVSVAGPDGVRLGAGVVGTVAGVVTGCCVTITASGVVARAAGDRPEAAAVGVVARVTAALVVEAAGSADDTGGLGSATCVRCS
jgi:hypothetical protein